MDLDPWRSPGVVEVVEEDQEALKKLLDPRLVVWWPYNPCWDYGALIWSWWPCMVLDGLWNPWTCPWLDEEALGPTIDGLKVLDDLMKTWNPWWRPWCPCKGHGVHYLHLIRLDGMMKAPTHRITWKHLKLLHMVYVVTFLEHDPKSEVIRGLGLNYN